MSSIFVSKAPAGLLRCARCKRFFKPKKEGDRYGPKCAVKQANDHIEVKNTDGEVVAVIV